MDMDLVKKLREISGASYNDCVSALEETKGDIEKAGEVLKRRGKAIASKKSSRETRSGIIFSYIHPNNKIGVLLDLRCETDFVAKNDNFKELAHELSLQIAAMSPKYVSPEDVSEEYIENEKKAYMEEMKDTKKPKDILEKIVEGKIKKELSDFCLLNQMYIKDSNKSIKQLIEEYIAKIGENIKIEKFCRFEI
jgi:elongation factor Ts